MNFLEADPAVAATLLKTPQNWLVTGAAGFIGSHLVETLLAHGQQVVGLDNFATGFRSNIELLQRMQGLPGVGKFEFIEGDIKESALCQKACTGIDVVLHQAALGSVGRSFKNPLATHQANTDGFLNILLAAQEARVKRFIYASSSSVYGDSPVLPKVEDQIGAPLSPYSVTKLVDEMYAGVFWRSHKLPCIGLRYFNVFGPRQSPAGEYAAVIPRWIQALANNEPVCINGDGETSRDFCFIANAVRANLRAAQAGEVALGKVYNVACGEATTLNSLFQVIKENISHHNPAAKNILPRYEDFRTGDIRHSLADIKLAHKYLDYTPTVRVNLGIQTTVSQFFEQKQKLGH